MTHYNGTLRQAARALRFLAEHDRPQGGESFPNSLSCHQLADELEDMIKKLAEGYCNRPDGCLCLEYPIVPITRCAFWIKGIKT